MSLKKKLYPKLLLKKTLTQKRVSLHAQACMMKLIFKKGKKKKTKQNKTKPIPRTPSQESMPAKAHSSN